MTDDEVADLLVGGDPKPDGLRDAAPGQIARGYEIVLADGRYARRAHEVMLAYVLGAALARVGCITDDVIARGVAGCGATEWGYDAAGCITATLPNGDHAVVTSDAILRECAGAMARDARAQVSA